MDIYELLKSEHAEICILLDELVSLEVDDDYRYVLMEEIQHLLISHSRSEEKSFYNSLRKNKRGKSLLFRCLEDHIEIETYLRTLKVMDQMDMDWTGIALKLKRIFTQHVKRVEEEVFILAESLISQKEAYQLGVIHQKLKTGHVSEGFFKNGLYLALNLLPPRISYQLKKMIGHEHSTFHDSGA